MNGTRPSRPAQWCWRAVAHRAALGAGVVGVVLVAGVVSVTPDGDGLWQPLDNAVRDAFGPGRWAGARSVVWAASLLVAVLAVPAVVWAAPVRRRRRTLVASLSAAGLAGLLAIALALVLDRPAPYQQINIDAARHDHSFPSIIGALTVAVIAAGLLAGGRSARRGVTFALAIAASIAAVRVATASTWFLDEFAGGLVGAVAVACVRPLRPLTPRPPLDRRRIVAGAIAGAAVLGAVAVSYGQYLVAPGAAPFADRTVEYLRDHGLAAVVDRTETWWSWTHAPPTSGRLARLPTAPLAATPPVIAAPTTTTPRPSTPARGGPTLPSVPPTTAAPASTLPATTSPPPTTADASTLPAPIALVQPQPLPGEGQWTVEARDPIERVEVATTTYRPDIDHPTIVAAVVWISHLTTGFSLFAGLREPGGGPGPAGAQVPTDQRSTVLAAFNSGYRMKDHPGGAYVEGRMVQPLDPGLATAAISADGHLDIGAWGSEIDPNGQYAALRQNLHLMVDNGAVVPGVATNAHQQWGTVKNAFPTWRSGLGITANGDVVYTAGNNLSLGVLADILQRAGAQRAMELDIHRGKVAFNLFSHDNGTIVGHELLPDMNTPSDRYLVPGWRDFFTVTPAG